MRIIVCENYEELSEKAAQIVASQVTLKPDSVLGLATGSTPIGLYNKLAKMYAEGKLDFSCVKTFNLDEYYPIKKTNTQSYDFFMQKNLFSKINIKRENTYIPNGETKNPQKECENYDNLIKANGGIDLQILGIGKNGHIGFNEPDATLNSMTHLTNLTEDTINANSRFFDSFEDVPKQALTMGIYNILTAKKIVLLANGASKRKVVSELISGGINTKIPATMLNAHPDVVLICDRDSYMGARMGVDVGGTNIKFAVVDNEKLIYKDSIKTPDTEEGVVDGICTQIERMKKDFDIKTVGIGIPGEVKDGLVSTDNAPFCNTPLEKMVKERTGICVSVDNDANCAAIGELVFGSTKDCDNIIIITIGTGIGGGIVMNRQICHSNHNMGEIGHMIIDGENGRPCPCGQIGCWEMYCSMTAFLKDAKGMAEKNPESILFKILKDDAITGEAVFKAIDEGCPVAKKVFDVYIRRLATGINSLVNIFGPDAIILAGGVTRQGENLLKPLKKLVKGDTRLEISTLQNDAGALGAAML